MRALLWLGLGLVLFVAIAAAIVPSGARVIALPAAVVAGLMLVVLIVVRIVARRDEEEPS